MDQIDGMHYKHSAHAIWDEPNQKACPEQK